ASGPRHLRLQVFDRVGTAIQTVDVQAAADEGQAIEVRVAVPAAPPPPSPVLTELDATLGLNLPPSLLTFLAGHGISSLADVRQAGGIGQLPGLPVPVDDPAVKTLEAHASLSWLSSDVQLNATLIGQGYTSMAAIASAPRADFVTAAQEQL